MLIWQHFISNIFVIVCNCNKHSFTCPFILKSPLTNGIYDDYIDKYMKLEREGKRRGGGEQTVNIVEVILLNYVCLIMKMKCYVSIKLAGTDLQQI